MSRLVSRRMFTVSTATVLGLVAAVLVPVSTPQALTGAALVSASPSDVLVVAPGKIGSFRMGTSTKKAKKQGWVSYGMCGWDAGRRAVQLDQDGDEVFKAYPDKVSKGRVRSIGRDTVGWPQGDGGSWPHSSTRRAVVTELFGPTR